MSFVASMYMYAPKHLCLFMILRMEIHTMLLKRLACFGKDSVRLREQGCVGLIQDRVRWQWKKKKWGP